MEKTVEQQVRGMFTELIDIRTPETIKSSRSFFTKAKVDLKGAKILYKKKIFDNSIFLLQQSVEKAAKGYFMLHSRASKSKLKEIGHKEPLLFIELFRNSLKYSDVIKFYKPDWSPDFIEGFNKLMADKAKLARMNKEIIIKLIKIPNQFFDPKSEAGKEILSIWDKGKLAQTIKSIVDEKGVIKDEIVLKNVLESVYALYSLLILAYVTFFHAVSTRYPGELINPAEYKKGLGIVDAAPRIFKELDKTIKIIERQLGKANPI